MRAAPALQVSVSRFARWRCAVAALGAAAGAAASAWIGAHAELAAHALSWLAACGAALGAWAVAAANRPAAFVLGWDGSRWQLGGSGPAQGDPQTGDVRVMADLGGFLLLRFEPDEGRSRPWLPVQRQGLEPQWHALRCAVYSPTSPASSPPADAAPPE